MDNFNLEYFHTGNGICADDFENPHRGVILNIDFILSIRNLELYQLPFSGKNVGYYSIVTMSNNDKYYIKKDTFNDLTLVVTNYLTLKTTKHE